MASFTRGGTTDQGACPHVRAACPCEVSAGVTTAAKRRDAGTVRSVCPRPLSITIDHYKMVDQVYREATAVHVALGESLTRLGLTVTPVICLHRDELPSFNKTVRGVRWHPGGRWCGCFAAVRRASTQRTFGRWPPRLIACCGPPQRAERATEFKLLYGWPTSPPCTPAHCRMRLCVGVPTS